MSENTDDLKTILVELERTEPEQAPKIPRELVARWMANPDVEVKGAVYALTSQEQHTRRINPPLTFEMDKEFVLSYLGQCIAEDPPLTAQFAESRFSACSTLVDWFRELWNDATIPRQALSDIKNWIRLQYLNGTEDVRRVLVQATLEHLFEDASIRRFFFEWQSDPALAGAYAQAIRWAEARTQRH